MTLFQPRRKSIAESWLKRENTAIPVNKSIPWKQVDTDRNMIRNLSLILTYIADSMAKVLVVQQRSSDSLAMVVLDNRIDLKYLFEYLHDKTFACFFLPQRCLGLKLILSFILLIAPSLLSIKTFHFVQPLTTLFYFLDGLPWGLSGKESACQCKRCEFDPWIGKIPWRRKWQPTPVFLPGKSHGQRSLVAGGLQSMGSKRVGRSLAIKQQQYCLIHELLNKANYVFKFTWLNFIFFIPSWHHLSIITFQRPHFQTPSHWGLGLNPWILCGHQHQSETPTNY